MMDTALYISLPFLFLQEEELFDCKLATLQSAPKNQIFNFSDLMMGYARNSYFYVSRFSKYILILCGYGLSGSHV